MFRVKSQGSKPVSINSIIIEQALCLLTFHVTAEVNDVLFFQSKR